MGPPWNLWKYEAKTAAEALDKLWNHMRSKKEVHGTARQRHVEAFLIDVPKISGNTGKLIEEICSPANLDERVSRLAQLCRRVAEGEQAEAHEDTLRGIAHLLERLGKSVDLSEEAKAIAKEAAKIALKRFGRSKK